MPEGSETLSKVPISEIRPFAESSDFEECRRLHRKYGSTYYFASRRFPAEIRRRVDVLYGFVRVPDEIVDNPLALGISDPSSALRAFRKELLQGLEGERPTQPVLRAFCDLCQEVKMSGEEPLRFLDAMEADLTVSRYATFDELRGYMRGSASAVGLMMCHVLEVECDAPVRAAAMALSEAMQLTNFLRDVGEDAVRNRIYLPMEDLDDFNVSCDQILEGVMTESFRRLMRFEIERARELYRQADAGIPKLPKATRSSIYLARVLYSRILDRIERRDYDVFSGRARTSSLEKLAVAGAVWARTIGQKDP